jgi:hypothetical protein
MVKQEKIDVSIPKGDTIKEDIVKLIGRTPLASFVVELLHKFRDEAKGIDGKPNLPDWRVYKKYLLEVNNCLEIDKEIDNIKHLLRVAESALRFVTDTEPT